MTKVPDSHIAEPDRPALQSPEIEITPQMIEAGVEVYLGHCPDSGVGDALDCKMVAQIYAAMSAARL